jgi:hypothetical protein
MIDSFPFDEWTDDIAGYWTFGPGNSTGTYVLTVLGIALMLGALIGWVVMENKKLEAQANLLRSAGGLPVPPPTGPGPSQPPMAGPSTDPGM